MGYAVDLGIIIAQKAWLELALHTRGAINNGLSELEIREAVLQATVYCGTPAGVEAMLITEKAVNEMVEKGEYKRPEALADVRFLELSFVLSKVTESTGFFTVLVRRTNRRCLSR